MKNLILASIMSVTASVATAADFKVTGTVTGVYPVSGFKNVTVDNVQCYQKEVTTGSVGSDALGGAIVGGIIGKIITGDDSGAAAGAIMGGVIGADKSRPQTQIQEVCTNVPRTTRIETILHYVVSYTWNGFEGEFQTKNGNYYVNQPVELNLKLTRF